MYNLSEEQRATLLYIFDHLIVTGPDQAAPGGNVYDAEYKDVDDDKK